jgi:predicted GH43/DUF377 family glycosyl hydrolase
MKTEIAYMKNRPTFYPDERPSTFLRLNAEDQGVILRHGDGPDGCDAKCAREAIIFKENGLYHLFYDGCSVDYAWRVCLAVSEDLVHWEKKGPILELGASGEMDSAAACSPWVYREGNDWHMFYIGTPNLGKDGVPNFPYLTFKAKSHSLSGPWIKQRRVVPFRTCPNTYYSATASAGHVIKYKGEYLQFFSATANKRTLGIARTQNLDGSWTIDPNPILPIEEQIENTSLYYEPSCKLWFLFTNHIGMEKDEGEYTDAVWMYWSADPTKWNPENKAVVLDGENCIWSKKCVGLPSVIPVGGRLAIFYDAPGDESTSHFGRNVGLAWLELPLSAPDSSLLNQI